MLKGLSRGKGDRDLGKRANCVCKAKFPSLSGTRKLNWLFKENEQERTPTAVSQLLTQIQDLHNKGEFLGPCKRILRSRGSEQLWSIPRSQPTLDYSESQRNAQPRFWIAARYTEHKGYFRKRF